MIKTIYILVFLTTSVIFSQNNTQIISFKDGIKKEVYLVSSTNGKVKFKLSKESDTILKCQFSEITRIDYIDNKDTISTFYYKKPENKIETIELILLHNGAVKLYRGIDEYNAFSVGSNFEYYLQKKGGKLIKIYPKSMGGTGIRKNVLKKYFSDCPKLVELIDKNAFERYFSNKPELSKSEKLENSIAETVKYYNSKCTIEK